MLSNRTPVQPAQSVHFNQKGGGSRFFQFEVYAEKDDSESDVRPLFPREGRDIRIPGVVADLAEMLKDDRVLAVRPAMHKSQPSCRTTDSAAALAASAATTTNETQETRNASSAEVAADAGNHDLACVIESWPALPPSIQLAILAIVEIMSLRGRAASSVCQ